MGRLEHLQALCHQHELSRIDVGYRIYGRGHSCVGATIWYDVPEHRPENVHGCSGGSGQTEEEALGKALADVANVRRRLADWVLVPPKERA